jgi:hypothetical protein
VVSLLQLAVLKSKPSLHAAYQSQYEEPGVSVKSVYDKLAGTELRVTRELVRRTSRKMRAIIAALGMSRRELLTGYEVRILDGSHLRATEHRLDVHRMINGSPLPWQALVVPDPQRMFLEDMFPCECGHAQERLILQQLIEDLKPGIVWIADRNFCTSFWLQEVSLNRAWFIIRRHSLLPLEPIGELYKKGTTSTGTVYEQAVVHRDTHGAELKMRLIVLELDEKNIVGDLRIEILSNLSDDVSAESIADAYRVRSTIERVFGELTLSLNDEINPLAYPPSAILAYALALVSYNVLTVVRSAVSVVQGAEQANQISTYYMADKIASVSLGMQIALPHSWWHQEFGHLDANSLANRLKAMAGKVELRKYQKHTCGPKKLKPKRVGSSQHFSTQKLLNKKNCSFKGMAVKPSVTSIFPWFGGDLETQIRGFPSVLRVIVLRIELFIVDTVISLYSLEIPWKSECFPSKPGPKFVARMICVPS